MDAIIRDNDETRESPSKRSTTKRSWTQQEANSAISKYKADRSQQYYELVNETSKGSRAAKKGAQTLFGRNAIHRATGIPKVMVSKSPEWQSIRDALGLQKITGKKTHFGKAVDEASWAAGDQTAEAVERNETIQLIKRRISRKFTAAQANALIERVVSGECSADQAREILDTLDTAC